MLGIDAIVMLYHCAKVSAGDILEVGAYTGGATIAMGMGVRDSGTRKEKSSVLSEAAASISRGSAQRIAFKDLRKNLKRFGFLDQVTLINARSFDPDTIAMVRRLSSPRSIGLFVFDADAQCPSRYQLLQRPICRSLLDRDRRLPWAEPTRAESCECKWTSWSMPGDWSHWVFTVSERGWAGG